MQNLLSDYKYIYGPVDSWRLGRSLGVDPISMKEKICTYDCVYCQAGKTDLFIDKRKTFVPTWKIIKEIGSLSDIDIDYITFSGRGEPTLAENLGEIITRVREIRSERIAVITNASLINRKDVQRDLALADFVTLKFDAPNEEVFNAIDRPMKGIEFDRVLKGIKEFRSIYMGNKFLLQLMFIRDNEIYAKQIAKLVREIKPDGIQINTPLRPSNVKPLPKKDLERVMTFFEDIKTYYVYEKR